MKPPQRVDYLVVGLGNPGKGHHFSLHNSGSLAARILHGSMSEATKFQQKKEYLIATGQVGGSRIAIGLPRTYMNSSGRIIAEMMSELQLTPEQTLVLHDEADFPMGKVQVAKGRGSGGHRGIDSVIKHLGSDAFCRVRIGIDRPKNDAVNLTSHVLQQIRGEERRELIRAAAWAAQTCLYVLSHGGIDQTIKTINQRNTEKIIRSMVLEREKSAWEAAHRTKVTVNPGRRLMGLRRMLWSRSVTLGIHAWRRLMRARVIAITGSFAKTTTKDTLASVLEDLGPTCASVGSNNVNWGPAQTLAALRWRHRFGVIELGTDSPGEMFKAARFVKPDIAVVTWVAGAHTNAFPSLDAIAQEKSMLVRRIGRRGLVVLNADDRRVVAMRDLTNARAVTYGLAKNADYRIIDPSAQWPERLQFRIAHLDETVHVRTQMVGTQWSHAVAAAIAVAHECGLPLAEAAVSAGKVEPHEARLQVATLPNGVVFLRDEIDPSIHSARAAFAVLAAARTEGRRVVVTGPLKDIGLSHAKQDRQLAVEAAACADMVVFIDHAENLRTKIATAMEAGIPRERVWGFRSVREVAEFLRSELRRGDLVLLKGRTSDHLSRIFFFQTGHVACWVNECTIRDVCDRCPKLGYSPAVQLPLLGEKGQRAVSETREQD
jgi:UDP-N-acetylmuramoyl-tripeptide--D-alanyl-D-alanine ligase